MSVANTLGGYFVELGLITDQASFNAGKKRLDEFEASTRAIFGTVTKTSAALFGMAVAAGSVESAELKAARAIGVSTGALDKWKTAAGVAGVSANSLTSSMTTLETKMRRLKLGEFDMGLAKSLGMMGIGYADFAKMDADKRMREVFGRAGAMGDQEKAAQLVADILGQAGEEYYHYLMLSGKTLDQQLSEAQMLVFTTDQSKRKAMEFQAETKAIFGAGKSMGALFGSELAAGLTPLVQTTKKYIMANRELIQTKIIGFARGTADAMKAIFGVIEKTVPLILRLTDSFGGLDGILIKVGIGFAALNFARLTSGIAGIVKGVNILRLALKSLSTGLAMGAGFLILEDLFVFLIGGKSVTGYVLNHLDEIKKKFSDIIPEDLKSAYADMADSITRFKDAVLALFKALDEKGAGEAALRILKEFGKTAALFAGEVIESSIENLTNILNLLTAIMNKDWSQAWEATKETGKDIATGINPFTIKQKAINYGVKTVVDLVNGKNKIEDGIISPDGRVTQVSPNDWVFAAKDLGGIASAFIPPSLTNSVNAPQSITITQNFNIATKDSDISRTVMQSARQGAGEGLRQVLRDSMHRMQLMPGTL